MDSYEEHIQRLQEYPEELKRDWPAGNGVFRPIAGIGEICLIKTNTAELNTSIPFLVTLYHEIQNDTLVPSLEQLSISKLYILAKYQRRYDELKP